MLHHPAHAGAERVLACAALGLWGLEMRSCLAIVLLTAFGGQSGTFGNRQLLSPAYGQRGGFVFLGHGVYQLEDFFDALPVDTRRVVMWPPLLWP